MSPITRCTPGDVTDDSIISFDSKPDVNGVEHWSIHVRGDDDRQCVLADAGKDVTFATLRNAKAYCKVRWPKAQLVKSS